MQQEIYEKRITSNLTAVADGAIAATHAQRYVTEQNTGGPIDCNEAND